MLLLMSCEDNLKVIEAQIALHEELLRVLMEEVDRSWRNQFTVVVAQDIYLRTKYADCKTCEKQIIAEACLEAREKTGKCIFEVDFKELQKLPWPTKGEEGL